MIFLNLRRYISILSFLFISLFFSNLVIGQEENTETQNNTPVINAVKSIPILADLMLIPSLAKPVMIPSLGPGPNPAPM